MKKTTKTVTALISDGTPEDVKVATIQNKINEIVEITAKNEAIKIGTQTGDAVYEEGSLFTILSESAKNSKDIGRISKQTIEIRNIPIPRLMLTPLW